MSSDETQVISVKKQGLVGCILVLALLFSHIISSYYISKWMEFDSFGNPIFLHLIGMLIFYGLVTLLEYGAKKYELSTLKIYICFYILYNFCFYTYIYYPYLYKNYPMSFILFWIIPNLVLNILIFLEFISNYKDNHQGLFLVNLISIAISMILSHQIVYAELGLPTSDLPITVSFATGVGFVVFTPILFILFNTLLLSRIFSQYDKKLDCFEKEYIFLIFVCSLLGTLMLYNKINSGYIQYFLRNVAYETDFQFIPKYFETVEFKKEGKAIQDILTSKNSTARVRLHENGHISLMCIKKFRENSQLSKIYVFKYDDLAEFTYTNNQMVCKDTVLEQIMRDCQVETTP